MKKRIKYSLRSLYKKATPVPIRRWADALMIACATAATYGDIRQHATTNLIIIWVGIIAKFISSGFYQETDKVPHEQSRK